jgi:hypothetical protein
MDRDPFHGPDGGVLWLGLIDLNVAWRFSCGLLAFFWESG